MSELVTIITPCYNQERYIGQCIESVLSQSYENWEQIIVDDGSTDATLSIARSYRDPRIRVIAMPHRGLGALAESYNVALAHGSGSLVAILEGDDAWPREKFDRQVGSFADPSVFLTWGRGTSIDSNGRRMRAISTIGTRRSAIDYPSAQLFGQLVRGNLIAPAASVVVRRSALSSIGGFRQDGTDIFVDLPTWLALCARVEGKARFLNSELALYRVHATQTTSAQGSAMDDAVPDVVDAIVAQLDEATLRRLDWQRIGILVRVARDLRVGRRQLADGDYREARRVFQTILVSAVRWQDRGKASLGVLSSLCHRDLFSAVFRLRARYLAFLSSRSILPRRSM